MSDFWTGEVELRLLVEFNFEVDEGWEAENAKEGVDMVKNAFWDYFYSGDFDVEAEHLSFRIIEPLDKGSAT